MPAIVANSPNGQPQGHRTELIQVLRATDARADGCSECVLSDQRKAEGKALRAAGMPPCKKFDPQAIGFVVASPPTPTQSIHSSLVPASVLQKIDSWTVERGLTRLR